MNNLHDLDLNLLVAFRTLLELRSVTATATRLGVTQSAMSHTLRRLREALDDPLFVRSGREMAPTPRALALAGPVGRALADLERALAEPDGFDPATTRRTFRMASVDLFDLLLLPRLSAGLRERAPEARLVVRPHGPDSARRLLDGRLDAAIHPVLVGAGPDPLPASGLARRTLLRDAFTTLVRRGHPLEDGMDLDAYCAASHLLVSPDGEGPGVVDTLLQGLGRTRQVVTRVHAFATALPVVAASDLVLTGPTSLVHLEHPGVVQVETPLALPEHLVTLVWAERMTADPGHRWFRELLVEQVALAWGGASQRGTKGRRRHPRPRDT